MSSRRLLSLPRAIARRPTARWAAVGGVLGAALAAGGLTFAFSTDGGTESEARAARVGAATASAGSQPVLVVDGVTITDGDLSVYRAGVTANIEYMRGAIVDVPDPAASEGLAARLALIEAYGVEAVAVAAAIGAAVVEAEAIRGGLAPSPAEIEDYNQRIRAALHESPEIPGAASARAYVDAVGEERYWEEIAPRQTARGLASERVYQRVVADASGDPQAAWALHRQGLFDHAALTIIDRDAISGPLLEQARAYHRAYTALEIEQAGA